MLVEKLVQIYKDTVIKLMDKNDEVYCFKEFDYYSSHKIMRLRIETELGVKFSLIAELTYEEKVVSWGFGSDMVPADAVEFNRSITESYYNICH